MAAGMDTSGDEYDFQVSRREILDDARPAALVEPSTPAVAPGNPRMTIPAGDLQQMQTFAIVLYPSVEDGARECALRARQHAQILDNIVVLGLVDRQPEPAPGDPDPDPPAGTILSEVPPWRIPVWDYDGVAVNETVEDDPYTYLTVESWSVQPLQDPLDDKRWSIPASMRVSWWRPGRVEEGEAVASVPGNWAGETPPP